MIKRNNDAFLLTVVATCTSMAGILREEGESTKRTVSMVATETDSVKEINSQLIE